MKMWWEKQYFYLFAIIMFGGGCDLWGTVFGLTGDNVCQEQERYVTAVRKPYKKAVRVRGYKWCLQVPPRCEDDKTVFVTDFRIEEEERIRYIEKCCPGFKPDADDNGTCVPMLCDYCDHGKCNPTIGDCICDDGYTGQNCDISCPFGRWGFDCREQCDCQNSVGCQPTDGVCICEPGWIGKRCDTKCPDGRYGQNCRNTCPECLSMNMKCNPINGICAPPNDLLETVTEAPSGDIITKIDYNKVRKSKTKGTHKSKNGFFLQYNGNYPGHSADSTASNEFVPKYIKIIPTNQTEIRPIQDTLKPDDMDSSFVFIVTPTQTKPTAIEMPNYFTPNVTSTMATMAIEAETYDVTEGGGQTRNEDDYIMIEYGTTSTATTIKSPATAEMPTTMFTRTTPAIMMTYPSTVYDFEQQDPSELFQTTDHNSNKRMPQKRADLSTIMTMDAAESTEIESTTTPSEQTTLPSSDLILTTFDRDNNMPPVVEDMKASGEDIKQYETSIQNPNVNAHDDSDQSDSFVIAVPMNDEELFHNNNLLKTTANSHNPSDDITETDVNESRMTGLSSVTDAPSTTTSSEGLQKLGEYALPTLVITESPSNIVPENIQTLEDYGTVIEAEHAKELSTLPITDPPSTILPENLQKLEDYGSVIETERTKDPPSIIFPENVQKGDYDTFIETELSTVTISNPPSTVSLENIPKIEDYGTITETVLENKIGDILPEMIAEHPNYVENETEVTTMEQSDSFRANVITTQLDLTTERNTPLTATEIQNRNDDFTYGPDDNASDVTEVDVSMYPDLYEDWDSETTGLPNETTLAGNENHADGKLEDDYIILVDRKNISELFTFKTIDNPSESSTEIHTTRKLSTDRPVIETTTMWNAATMIQPEVQIPMNADDDILINTPFTEGTLDEILNNTEKLWKNATIIKKTPQPQPQPQPQAQAQPQMNNKYVYKRVSDKDHDNNIIHHMEVTLNHSSIKFFLTDPKLDMDRQLNTTSEERIEFLHDTFPIDQSTTKTKIKTTQSNIPKQTIHKTLPKPPPKTRLDTTTDNATPTHMIRMLSTKSDVSKSTSQIPQISTLEFISLQNDTFDLKSMFPRKTNVSLLPAIINISIFTYPTINNTYNYYINHGSRDHTKLNQTLEDLLRPLRDLLLNTQLNVTSDTLRIPNRTYLLPVNFNFSEIFSTTATPTTTVESKLPTTDVVETSTANVASEIFITKNISIKLFTTARPVPQSTDDFISVNATNNINEWPGKFKINQNDLDDTDIIPKLRKILTNTTTQPSVTREHTTTYLEETTPVDYGNQTEFFDYSMYNTTDRSMENNSKSKQNVSDVIMKIYSDDDVLKDLERNNDLLRRVHDAIIRDTIKNNQTLINQTNTQTIYHTAMITLLGIAIGIFLAIIIASIILYMTDTSRKVAKHTRCRLQSTVIPKKEYTPPSVHYIQRDEFMTPLQERITIFNPKFTAEPESTFGNLIANDCRDKVNRFITDTLRVVYDNTYDHPQPPTANGSFVGSTFFAPKSEQPAEHLYDEIPAWKQPKPLNSQSQLPQYSEKCEFVTKSVGSDIVTTKL